MKYEKTQTGWLLIAIISLVMMSLTIGYLTKLGTNPLSLMGYVILMAILIFVLLMFYKLKIRVDDLGIHVIYGFGLIHIKINPEKVNQVKIVKTPWYYGFGIRFIGRGMLYNIQGPHAVEIAYSKGTSKGKTVLIGSDDTIALKDAIEKRYNVSEPL